MQLKRLNTTLVLVKFLQSDLNHSETGLGLWEFTRLYVACLEAMEAHLKKVSATFHQNLVFSQLFFFFSELWDINLQL